MRYIDLDSKSFRKDRKENHESGLKLSKFKKMGLIFVVLILVGGFVFAKQGLGSIFAPVSVFSKISGQEALKQEDGYTHFLLVGLDRREQEDYNGGLNDTIMVVSVNPTLGKAHLFSVPRDLWVPMEGDTYGKINSAYNRGGVELLRKVVSNIMGVPIHYWVVADFEGFKKGIDLLGGIEVNVERSFDDYRYPIEGKENVFPEEDRYEHIHFDKGWQDMNGETALKFARSRHALGPEGSDFARANRQQKVILAAKEKALSAETLFNPVRLKRLYDVFGSHVETNITVVQAQKLYDTANRISLNEISTHLVSQGAEGNLFYTPKDLEPYGGAWVLLPKAGDYSEVQRFVHELLFVAE